MMEPLVGRLPVIAQILAIWKLVKGSEIKVGSIAKQGQISGLLPTCVQNLKLLPQMRGMQQLQQGQFSRA